MPNPAGALGCRYEVQAPPVEQLEVIDPFMPAIGQYDVSQDNLISFDLR